MIPAAFPLDGGKDRNMIKKYEDACRKAGLSEEQTTAIRKVFKQDLDRLWYEKKKMEKYRVFTFSCSEASEDGKMLFELDAGISLEDDYIHELELQRLHDALSLLEEDDRELLYAFFDKDTVFTDFARKTGENRSKLLRRKNKLVKKLREMLKDIIQG